MKMIRSFWRCLCAGFAKIHIVDKFLIVFMAILLMQSAHNLFANHTAVGEAGTVDIIVRTSIAAIFGYFLSTNFVRNATPRIGGSDGNSGQIIMPQGSAAGMKNRIGFEQTDADNTLDTPKIGSVSTDKEQPHSEISASRIQVITASLVGLFCLVVLILMRNASELNAGAVQSPSTAATVAQFRDIVSGCIGFLIGCPTTEVTQSK